MPEPNLGFGARDSRALEFRFAGADALFATPSPPAKDGRAVFDAGTAGGPMEVLVPPTLGRGLDIVIEGGLVLEGVPPRGVEVEDVAADNCFVGDFVGDYFN